MWSFSVVRLQYLTLFSKIRLHLSGLKCQVIPWFPIALDACPLSLRHALLLASPTPYSSLSPTLDILTHQELNQKPSFTMAPQDTKAHFPCSSLLKTMQAGASHL